MQMKICRTCGELKPLDDFYRHYHTLDGHKGTCKACECAAQNARRAAKKEGVTLPPIERRDPRRNLAEQRTERRGRKRASADRPVWYYKGSMAENIKALEADGQPWLIAKYRIGARYVDGDNTPVYELVIFQTYGSQEGYDTLMMSKDDFLDTMHRLGVSTKPIYESADGRIFGRDNRLRDIVKSWNAICERARTKERSLHQLYVNAVRWYKSSPEATTLAEAQKKAHRDYKAEVARNEAARATFLKKHHIIQYNF